MSDLTDKMIAAGVDADDIIFFQPDDVKKILAAALRVLGEEFINAPGSATPRAFIAGLADEIEASTPSRKD
jgi:hypothetical protein